MVAKSESYSKGSWLLIGISKVFAYLILDVKPDLENFIVVRFIEEIYHICFVIFVTYNVPIYFRVAYNWCIATSEHTPRSSVAIGETMVIHRNKCWTFDHFENFFFWEDQIVYITKVVDNGFNHKDFIEKVLEVNKRPTLISMDYHGFTQCNGEPRFVLGSRHWL